MRTLISALFFLCLIACGPAQKTSNETIEASAISDQDLLGAWKYSYADDNDQQVEVVMTFSGGYFSQASYVMEPPQFLNTFGGAADVKGRQLILTFEYDVQQPDRVGTSDTLEIDLDADRLVVGDRTWQRIDDGAPGVLADTWLITGRERNREMRFWTPEARKTMKILSGTRFQWIAYNTDDGGFFGTGGGTYTTEEGTYTENIEFFSRDSSRVGSSLAFQYELDSGQWHHRGLSSRGDPIYEVWTPRSMLD
jgi:hypothetical protein